MIILTETFKDNFFDIFKHKLFFEEFCRKLSQKSHKLIDLKYPYKKCKFEINYVSVRWIILISKDSDLIPLFVIKKKNKKMWDNLVLDKETMKYIESLLPKILNDIKNYKFEKIK